MQGKNIAFNPESLRRKRPHLEMRAKVIAAMRDFFNQRGFTEVQTATLQVTPGAEAHIHGFKTELLDHNLDHKSDLYLHTSPEFAMKKLLCAGWERIYQICPCYRNGEESSLHAAEFTMIEWYRTQADYTHIMDDCVDMLRMIAKICDISVYSYKGMSVDPFGEWQKISVAEAFEQFAGIDLAAYLEDTDAFASACAAVVRTSPNDGWDDLFFRVMGEVIEPNLGTQTPCILYDYPAHMAALSRKKPGDPRFAERFELYIAGVELANAFSELTDAAEQRARFEDELALKEKLYSRRYPIDEEFLSALERGLPESGGIALGIDRLCMLASGAEDIEDVLWR